MKILVLFTVLFMNPIASFTSIQPSKGKVEFSINKALSKVKGEFTDFNYTIDLNESGSASIYGTAEVKSVATGNSKRDKHLQNEEWFYAEKHPQIKVRSKKINKQKEGEYIGTFEITIKGKPLIKEIPFKIVTENSQKTLISSFELSKKHFDIGGGFVSNVVGDKVKVDLNLPF